MPCEGRSSFSGGRYHRRKFGKKSRRQQELRFINYALLKLKETGVKVH